MDEYVEVHSPEVDSDGDGMPDIWEEQNGLNPADKSDAVKYNLSKDYTNLEIYINLKSASNLNGNLNCSKELEHYAS